MRKAWPILCDWGANRHNWKGRLVLASYRLCRRIWTATGLVRMLGSPFLLLHRIVVEWIFGVELGWRVDAGPELRLFHGTALVVHPNAVLGARCTLRHCTTLGTRQSNGAAPRLGDDVDVGSNSVILGDVTIGNGAVIGAGSVVLNDVLPRTVVAGNPARPIRTA